MADLLALGDRLAAELKGADQVPRSLVGKSYFIFTQMLAEADHPRSSRSLMPPRQWQERLRRAFGPTFD